VKRFADPLERTVAPPRTATVDPYGPSPYDVEPRALDKQVSPAHERSEYLPAPATAPRARPGRRPTACQVSAAAAGVTTLLGMLAGLGVIIFRHTNH
jgi:hypothetical protein